MTIACRGLKAKVKVLITAKSGKLSKTRKKTALFRGRTDHISLTSDLDLASVCAWLVLITKDCVGEVIKKVKSYCTVVCVIYRPVPRPSLLTTILGYSLAYDYEPSVTTGPTTNTESSFNFYNQSFEYLKN